MTSPKLVRTVFMGSPEFALPVLQRLSELVSIVGVITQPDRPSGRGRSLTAPPVKRLADSLGLPAIQPPRLRAPEAFEMLVSWQPDLIVVAAYGQILRQQVLELPPFGCINVHASLLPRWRGASPIQAALLHGDEETGVTIMRMDAGVDTGDIIAQMVVPIVMSDNAATLSLRLADAGANLLVETLPAYLQGKLIPQPQDESKATYAPILKKEDGLLQFQNSPIALNHQVKAFTPWPGAFFHWDGQTIKVLQAKPFQNCPLPEGATGVIDGIPAIGCRGGFLQLTEVQPSGKKPMTGKTFLNGARNWGSKPVNTQ